MPTFLHKIPKLTKVIFMNTFDKSKDKINSYLLKKTKLHETYLCFLTCNAVVINAKSWNKQHKIHDKMLPQ